MGEMKHTPGPWEYVPGNENHGPYVSNPWGAGDICDCYTMSNPSSFAICNGGNSKPINHQHEEAEANACLIAAAPDLLEAAQRMVARQPPGQPDNGPLYDEFMALRAALTKASPNLPSDSQEGAA